MPEYLAFRCCMCPNSNNPQNTVCPAGGPQNKPDTPCRFVKEYVDNRGWRYKVMSGLGENNYKARYSKPGKSSWHCCRQLPWRDTFDKAQADMNTHALKKGWRTI